MTETEQTTTDQTAGSGDLTATFVRDVMTSVLHELRTGQSITLCVQATALFKPRGIFFLSRDADQLLIDDFKVGAYSQFVCGSGGRGGPTIPAGIFRQSNMESLSFDFDTLVPGNQFAVLLRRPDGNDVAGEDCRSAAVRALDAIPMSVRMVVWGNRITRQVETKKEKPAADIRRKRYLISPAYVDKPCAPGHTVEMMFGSQLHFAPERLWLSKETAESFDVVSVVSGDGSSPARASLGDRPGLLFGPSSKIQLPLGVSQMGPNTYTVVTLRNVSQETKLPRAMFAGTAID